MNFDTVGDIEREFGLGVPLLGYGFYIVSETEFHKRMLKIVQVTNRDIDMVYLHVKSGSDDGGAIMIRRKRDCPVFFEVAK